MKLIAVLIFCVVLSSLLFFGCTSPPAGDTTITTQAGADKALTDVSTDLSGINNSLNQIDNTLAGDNNSGQ